MKGGTLRCNRTEERDSECLTLSCVDYEKGMFNSFKQVECNPTKGWKKYRDNEADANYWYNHDTGEATWSDPATRGGKFKSRKYGKNKSRKYTFKKRSRKNKKSRRK